MQSLLKLITSTNLYIGTNLPIIIASITFLILCFRYVAEFKHLKVILGYSKYSSILLLPNRKGENSPDKYSSYLYRVILDVVITNKSSKPISIIACSLGALDIKYTHYMNPGIYRVNDGKITYTYDLTKTNSFNFPITLAPYESLESNLVFLVNNKNDIELGECSSNQLKLITSRGTSSFKLPIKKCLIDTDMTEYDKNQIINKKDIFN